MALKPVLKIKVDELFLRWLSDSDVQTSLRDSLVQIAKGEAVSAAAKVSIAGRGNSPRGNASSFVTPTSPKLPSPGSPRRSTHGKKNVPGIMGVEAAKVTCREVLGSVSSGYYQFKHQTHS